MATKYEVAGIEERIDQRCDALDRSFDAFEARFGERMERAVREQTVILIAILYSGLALFAVVDRILR